MRLNKPYLFLLMLISCCIFAVQGIYSQPPIQRYTVKNGKMYIQLSRDMKETSLDSFITQFALEELALKQFIRTGFRDSLQKFGWWVEKEDHTGFIITKALEGFDNFNNPAEKIRFTEKDIAAEFPSVSNNVILGYNRFRNKSPFIVRDSVVTFFMKGNTGARKVNLAGSFNNWRPDTLAMKRTDSGWVANVTLTPGKYWYKFVIDGHWDIDHDNRISENDGRGNTNSVYYVTNTVFRLKGFENAWKVILSGSFNNWNEKELVMTKTTGGWELPLYLADGTHTYRYIIDGKWYTDPSIKDRFPNEFDDYNSVIRIGSPSIFRLNGYPNAKQVVLTGSFNKWRKDELFMKKNNGVWELEYTLGPGNHTYRVIVDGVEITDQQNLISINNVNKNNNSLVLDANYTFRLKGFPNAKKVSIAGDFNEWDPKSLQMVKEGNDWVFKAHLSPGKHVYKFVVDGKWIIDPDNVLWEQNEFGTGNSVLWIEPKNQRPTAQ